MNAYGADPLEFQKKQEERGLTRPTMRNTEKLRRIAEKVAATCEGLSITELAFVYASVKKSYERQGVSQAQVVELKPDVALFPIELGGDQKTHYSGCSRGDKA